MATATTAVENDGSRMPADLANLSGATPDIGALYKQIADLTADKGALTTQVQQLTADNSSLTSQLANLKTQATNEINGLNATVSQQNAYINRFREATNTLNTNWNGSMQNIAEVTQDGDQNQILQAYHDADVVTAGDISTLEQIANSNQ